MFQAGPKACDQLHIFVSNSITCVLPLTGKFLFMEVLPMKPSDILHTHRRAIRHVVESHRARNARVFGSAAVGKDTESSDLDILIDPTPQTTLLDIGAIRHELGALLGVPVDVLTPKALPDSFRERVLREAAPI